jgi:hypothetical protein
VVTFSTSPWKSDPATRLAIAAKITPSGQRFQLPNSKESYPGIVMSADMNFLGKDVHVDVRPAEDIEFKYFRMGVSLEGLSASDVAGGIMQGTCRQAAYAVLEKLTRWKRPAPPPRPTPEDECARGFHCRENAETLETTDRAAAARLYAKACQHDDEDACVRAADLEVALPGEDHRASAQFELGMACARDLARACTALGRIALVPREPGRAPSPDDRREALRADLRACDLGEHDACAAAVPLVKGTPFADAAPLLAGAKSASSKTLGTIFALRWGQWTQMDQGQPTAWVTKPPPHPPEDALVTPFALDRVPAGIVAPPGTDTVYAVAFEKGWGDRCGTCKPSGGGGSLYSMRSMDCVCAIAPRAR